MNTALVVLSDDALMNWDRRYERALATVYDSQRVDDCRAYADQANALSVYAKRANDQSLYHLARRTELHAMRHCGVLLERYRPTSRGGNRSKVARRQPASNFQTMHQVGQQAGLSDYRQKQAVRIAAIPLEAFTAAINREPPPSVDALAKSKAAVVDPSSVPSIVAPKPPVKIDRSSKAAQARREQLRILVADGHNSRQIAEILGLSLDGCQNLARQMGVTITADKTMGRLRRHDPTRVIESIILDAENLTAGAELIDFTHLDPARIPEWLMTLRASARTLELFIRKLSKVGASYGKPSAALTA